MVDSSLEMDAIVFVVVEFMLVFFLEVFPFLFPIVGKYSLLSRS